MEALHWPFCSPSVPKADYGFVTFHNQWASSQNEFIYVCIYIFIHILLIQLYICTSCLYIPYYILYINISHECIYCIYPVYIFCIYTHLCVCIYIICIYICITFSGILWLIQILILRVVLKEENFKNDSSELVLGLWIWLSSLLVLKMLKPLFPNRENSDSPQHELFLGCFNCSAIARTK